MRPEKLELEIQKGYYILLCKSCMQFNKTKSNQTNQTNKKKPQKEKKENPPRTQPSLPQQLARGR